MDFLSPRQAAKWSMSKSQLDTLRGHPGLRNGLQLYRGQVTHAGLAEDLGLPYASGESLLA